MITFCATNIDEAKKKSNANQYWSIHLKHPNAYHHLSNKSTTRNKEVSKHYIIFNWLNICKILSPAARTITAAGGQILPMLSQCWSSYRVLKHSLLFSFQPVLLLERCEYVLAQLFGVFKMYNLFTCLSIKLYCILHRIALWLACRITWRH